MAPQSISWQGRRHPPSPSDHDEVWRTDLFDSCEERDQGKDVLLRIQQVSWQDSRARASNSVYTRLPIVWGEDADRWNPMRWVNMDTSKQIAVGVYANL